MDTEIEEIEESPSGSKGKKREAILTLNYKYLLRPNQRQERIMGGTMVQANTSWNLLVKYQKEAHQLLKEGKRSQLLRDIQEAILSKRLTANKRIEYEKLISKGKSDKNAKFIVNKDKLDDLWGWKTKKKNVISSKGKKRSVITKGWDGPLLEVKWAIEKFLKHRSKWIHKKDPNSSQTDLGATISRVVKRFEDSWKIHWESKKKNAIDPTHPVINPPKFKKRRFGARTLAIQCTNEILLRKNNRYNIAALGQLFPQKKRELFKKKKGATLSDVPLVLHRPIPEGGEIKQAIIVRSDIHPKAEWNIVFSVSFYDKQYSERMKKKFRHAGQDLGLDPGRSTAITASTEYKDWKRAFPALKFTDIKEKITDIQKKLSHKDRINNPQAFDENGAPKKGARRKKPTQKILLLRRKLRILNATKNRVKKQRMYHHIRLLLHNADNIYLGDWKPDAPLEKGKKRDSRKIAFKRSQKQRAMGKAKLERKNNREDSDNAASTFRTMLVDMAHRSATPKTVYEVDEAKIKSTQRCPNCGSFTGPKSTKNRKWTCVNCNHRNKRDFASAYNHVYCGKNFKGVAKRIDIKK